MSLWSGAGVALLTCFGDDLRVDSAATAGLAVRLVEDGVRGVLVAGTTGEADALDDAERAGLVRAVRAALPAAPLVAGVGGPWTGDVVRRVRAALDEGADAVLAPPPRSCRDVEGFFAAVVAAAEGAPVLGYHFPGVLGGPGVPLGLLPRLGLAGVKDSTGDAERLLLEVEGGLAGQVYVGAAPLASLAGAVGAAGAILAVANAEPALSVAAYEGEVGAQLALLDAHRVVRAEGLAGLKRLAAARYGVPTAVRLR